MSDKTDPHELSLPAKTCHCTLDFILNFENVNRLLVCQGIIATGAWVCPVWRWAFEFGRVQIAEISICNVWTSRAHGCPKSSGGHCSLCLAIVPCVSGVSAANWSHAHRLNTLDHWFSITECKGSKLYVLLGKWAQLKVNFIHNQGQFSSLVWSGKLDCVVTWMTNGFGELTLLPLPDLWAATIWFIKLVYKVQIEADYQQAVNVFSLLHVPWT